jgi:catechol 2,3-dioxygenase-like lactoylglutathione lyase family enzyme
MLQCKIIRVARPTDRLDEVIKFYTDGLGLQVLDRFVHHEGFDGVMVGFPGAPYHFEFTQQPGHLVGRAPTPENLIVFYIPERQEWQSTIDRLQSIDHAPMKSYNPYWDKNGITFEDPDGYRIVLENTVWEVG